MSHPPHGSSTSHVHEGAKANAAVQIVRGCHTQESGDSKLQYSEDLLRTLLISYSWIFALTFHWQLMTTQSQY